MTVTGATSLLNLFQSKIEEAVSFVPRMCAEEKLKAVQFWNIVSEKLQDIVNNSAADINAIALKMGEEDSEKISLEIEHSTTTSIVSQTTISSSEFINLSSSYAICSETDSQYNPADISNTHLKELLSTGSTFTSNTEQSLSNAVSNLPHIDSLNSSIHTCNKNNSQDVCEQFLSIQNLPTNSCDTFVIDSQPTSDIPRIISNVTDTKSSNSHLSIETQKSHYHLTRKSKNNSVCDNNENCDTNLISNPLYVSKDRKDMKKGSTKISHLILHDENMIVDSKNKLENSERLGVVSNISENSKDSNSDDKSDFDSVVNLDESNDSNCTEHIVSFVVSTSEEILAKNEVRREKSSQEKQINHVESPFMCKDCNKHFADSSALANHCWTHTKPFTCTDCQAQFSTKGNLIVHMRKHTGEKPYSCNKCSSRFSTKGNLKRHVKTHTGEKPWQCSRCGGRFTEKKSLTVHMRRHTGERPYQCNVCGKKFAQTGILQTHMAMHLDQKVHLCEHCGKSFRQKSQLRIHKLRHDNVRKYGCVSCSARFLTKGDLERHIRIHTGERPFACDVCAKTYTRQQSLNEHMNRHYGLRPYLCKYCGKCFAEMSACYKHIKQHEKANNVDGFISEDIDQPSKPETCKQICSMGNSEIKVSNACKEIPSKTTEIDFHAKESSSDIEAERNMNTPLIHNFLQ